MLSLVEKYLRVERLPHIWCPGCGHGIALGAMLRAVADLGLDKDSTVVVSGIGCSSRAAGYLDFDTLHTTHGRPLAFATGLKVAKPRLTVLVIAGDGDLAAIGGNHLIHAARRNIDITTVCFNNNIYGMTSGQFSPMTPKGSLATTAPYGTVDRPFDLCGLVRAAGATYVARSTVYHVRQLEKLLADAISHKGFSFVDVLSHCPTYFGRRNRLGGAPEMMRLLKEKSVGVQAARGMSPNELAGRFAIGELYRADEPEFTEEYEELVRRVQERTGEPDG